MRLLLKPRLRSSRAQSCQMEDDARLQTLIKSRGWRAAADSRPEVAPAKRWEDAFRALPEDIARHTDTHTPKQPPPCSAPRPLRNRATLRSGSMRKRTARTARRENQSCRPHPVSIPRLRCKKSASSELATARNSRIQRLFSPVPLAPRREYATDFRAGVFSRRPEYTVSFLSALPQELQQTLHTIGESFVL